MLQGECLLFWQHAVQIQDGMRSNLFRKGMTGERFDSPAVDPHHPDLVAYW